MDNKKFICYQVGEKYDKVMKTDGAVFEMYDQNGVISISVTNLTEDEIFALGVGQLDIYLSVIEGIIFVVAEFKDKFIFDMPFNYGLYEKFELENPAPYGFTVSVIAVEGIDNTIKAMRVVGLDSEFSQKLYMFTEKQWRNRIQNYDERLQSVYARYTSKDILKHAIAKNIVRRVVV